MGSQLQRRAIARPNSCTLYDLKIACSHERVPRRRLSTRVYTLREAAAQGGGCRWTRSAHESVCNPRHREHGRTPPEPGESLDLHRKRMAMHVVVRGSCQ